MLENTNIARLPVRTSKTGKPSIIRDLRRDYDLSIVQAAAALGTSTRNVEHWEAHPGLGPGEEVVRSEFESFKLDRADEDLSNMIFSVYPLKLAREILRLSLDEIAQEFGYSRSMWQKFESNDRLLDRSKLLDVEDRVRHHFMAACKGASSVSETT